eukprot:4155347-Pyramimonas_sp.AAC.1
MARVRMLSGRSGRSSGRLFPHARVLFGKMILFLQLLSRTSAFVCSVSLGVRDRRVLAVNLQLHTFV